MKQHCSVRGVSVVEVLVGVGIFALITIFTAHTISLFLENARIAQESTRALYLAEEGQESLRYIRDEHWNGIANLTVDTTYYFDLSTSAIATSTTAETIDGTYSRSFVLREVYRDSDDDIVASTTPGATVDAGSRTAQVQVSWSDGHVELETLLTNIFDI